MRAQGGRALAVLVLLSAFVAPAAAAQPPGETVTEIVGRGSAHGLGMAMDGVLGMARHGWAHDRILDTFYPGTSSGRAAGTIRVGLGVAPSQRLTLPGGGTVTSTGGGRGFPIDVPAASSVTVTLEGGRLVVDGVSAASSSSSPAPDLLPSGGPPLPSPTAAATPKAGATPTPEPLRTILPDDDAQSDLLAPVKTSTPPPTPGPLPSSDDSVWVTPRGDPAVTVVGTTGHRYRGRIQVRRSSSGGLVVVNHVDLETYVSGIAEEKGQGWPDEGLRALAVAARSLGAAARSWYAKNQPSGFDICATGACQVYLGYDGEEPAMRAAARATAGEIRTWHGRPILAMYHGNGGGQTESYAKENRQPEDRFPYLRSVRYPYADPKRWRMVASMSEIAQALQTGGVAVPGTLRRIEVLERGDSPRVLRLRLVGDAARSEVSGNAFARALGLPSTWFSFGEDLAAPTGAVGRSGAVVSAAGNVVRLADASRGPTWPRVVAPLLVGLTAIAAVATSWSDLGALRRSLADLMAFAQVRRRPRRRG